MQNIAFYVNTNVGQSYWQFVLIFGVKCDPDMLLTATRSVRFVRELIFWHMWNVFLIFSLYPCELLYCVWVQIVWVATHLLFSYYRADLLHYYQLLCCSARISHTYVHGNVSSHVFGLDLCAYVSEIRTATVRFVLMCGMPASPCVLKHFKRLAHARHKHTRLHLVKQTTGHKYLSQRL